AQAKITELEEGKADAKLEKALITARDKLITEEGKETAAVAAFEAVKSNIADSEAQIKRITADKEGNAKDVAAAEAAGETAKSKVTAANAELAEIKKAMAQPGVKLLDIAWSNDGGQIAGLFDDGTVRCWAVDTARPLSTTEVEIEKAAGIGSIEASSFVASDRDGEVLCCISPPEWKLVKIVEEDFVDRINALVFSPDGKHLAIGGGEPSRSGNITILDVESGKVAASWKECHEDTVISLDYSGDGKKLASGSADKIARVFDVKNGEQINLFEGHTHYVMDVTFRSDGRVLATAGADGIVNSWDMTVGEKKKKITGWNKEVTSIQFLGATNKMVASAGDNLIKILYDDGRLVRSIPGLPEFIQSVAGTPDGVTLVGGGEDSVLRVWDGTNSKELAKFGPK
ncbi:MAG: WD40 repeat domain-containing protein, partial [Verrucomicrobiales bacterium]|nr:WD40 repeat domain-containing protein [Verrucomicrobiales bacterium]